MGKVKDEQFMKRCLELALKGAGLTGPNPMVGSVIVHEGSIIGEGFHRKAGGPHAEVIAIASVKKKELLQSASLYVNLEPCSHYGKTPPCAELIVQTGIPRVVIGCADPNPLVSGKGTRLLMEAGIEVEIPVLEAESRSLNRRFISSMEKKRPYVILKWAQSADGFLDVLRKVGETPHTNWITNHTARMLVHKWRAEESAILTGVNTILSDNPKLNTRDWPGNSPVRILLDSGNRVKPNYAVFDEPDETWVFGPVKSGTTGNVRYFESGYPARDLQNVLAELSEKGIRSLLVEGGEKMLNSFLEWNLWDEARIFSGSACFVEGIKAPTISGLPEEIYVFRNQKLRIIKNKNEIL